MHKKILYLLLVLVILAGGYYGFKKFSSQNTKEPELGEPQHYESAHVEYFSNRINLEEKYLAKQKTVHNSRYNSAVFCTYKICA